MRLDALKLVKTLFFFGYFWILVKKLKKAFLNNKKLIFNEMPFSKEVLPIDLSNSIKLFLLFYIIIYIN